MDACWSFRRMGRGEINQDPFQNEFFIPTEGLADGLVRETIQNSLDARSSGEPVRVRYTFPAEPLDRLKATVYLRGLREHLPLGSDAIIDGNVSYLVVEDFNTVGLRGDPLQEDDASPETGVPRNDYYYFWRNIGRSDKSENDRGRWGLGKTVFPASSWIGSFWGLTVRDDGSSYLMGQSVQKTHSFDGRKYAPYGYFGLHEDEFCRTVATRDKLESFIADFGLSRKGQAGLSVVIPFTRGDDLKPNAVLKSAVAHFFYAVLAGDLTIEIVRDNVLVLVNRDSLREVAANQIEWDGDKQLHSRIKLFDLAAWSLSLAADQRTELVRQSKGAPKWDIDLIPPSVRAALRERFDRGERIGMTVPVAIERKGRAPLDASFEVYLEGDRDLGRGDDHYVRQGMTIAGMPMLGTKPNRGLVVVTDKNLSALLGDAENPAHTEWLPRATKVRERYVRGPSTVSFVRNSLNQLIRLLAQPPAGIDKNLLRDIFFIHTVAERPDPETPEGHGPKRKGPNAPAVPPPPARGQAFRIVRLPGGFRIVGAPDGPAPGAAIDVDLAYEIRKGNPFKRYDRCDFDVKNKPIVVSSDGVRVEEQDLNRLRFIIEKPDFAVEVKGFDVRRDLRVRALLRREEEGV
jgi:hypothetical protein